MQTLKFPRRASIALTIILALAHAPLLLNDGFYMDDWLNLKAGPGFQVDLTYLLKGAGHPLLYAYFDLANASGVPTLVMKAMAATAIILGANALLDATVRLGLLRQQEAVAFALIVWTYPGYQMWAGKANAGYVFSLGLFCIGVWLLVVHAQMRGGWRIAVRLAALGFFFCSFALNSLMALYAFVGIALVLAEWKRQPPTVSIARRSARSVLAAGVRYADFFLLPLAYWLLILIILFPRQGSYLSHYVVHVPSLAEWGAGFKAFWKYGYGVLYRRASAWKPADLTILVAMAGVVTTGLYLLDRQPAVHRSGRNILLPIIVAPLVFAAASMPYLVAGLRAGGHFYETRHLLLFGVPMALLALGVGRAVGQYWRWGPLIFFSAALSLLTTLLFGDYAFLQARWLKQEALIVKLKEGWPQPPALVFNLVDGFINYKGQHTHFGISEVTGALHMAWGQRPFVGFDLRSERPTVLREIQGAVRAKVSAYRNMDTSGPQATILLQPGPAAGGNTNLTLRYYACRLLNACDPRRLLADLARVQVQVGPIAKVIPVLR